MNFAPMNTTSRPSLLCRCLRSLQVLAGVSIFGLLYTNCGKSTTIEGGAEETQDTVEDVNAVTSANQASALSQGGLSGVGQVCAPYH